MTDLLAQMKEDTKAARLSRDKSASFRVTLLAEMQRVEKDTLKPISLESFSKILKRFKDGAQDTKKILLESNAQADVSVQDMELAIVDEYTPQQMTADELKAVVIQVLGSVEGVLDNKHKGMVMKELKAKYAGTYSADLANQVIAQYMASR